MKPELQVITDPNAHRPSGSLLLLSNEQFQSADKCDVLININSFCEMTENQVKFYLDSQRISWGLLYSNNRNRQFMNRDLATPLIELLEKRGVVWPSQNDYRELERTGISRSIDSKMVTVTVSGEVNWTPPIAQTDLVGLAGPPMQGLYRV